MMQFINKSTGILSMRLLFILFLTVVSPLVTHAQDRLSEARELTRRGDYEGAIVLYRQLYDQMPTDPEVYRDYLEILLKHKKFKDAEKLVKNQLEISYTHPIYYIDLGEVYKQSGKGKKADAQFQLALQQVNGDDMLTQQVARAFERVGAIDFTIQTYEKARNILRNPYMYYAPLARLYAKTGDMETAVEIMLEGGASNLRGIDDTKSTLLELIGTDAAHIRAVQKVLLKRIHEQPEHIYYNELLTWIYTQKDDWEGAFTQIRAIDARNRENGRRILDFALNARNAGKFEVAMTALNSLTERGAASPMYADAMAEKLSVVMDRLEQDPNTIDTATIRMLKSEYQQFFIEFPQFLVTETLLRYAALLAQFSDQPQGAVDLLETAVRHPGARRDFVGKAKLQLGDYYILLGRIWDAALTYGQVDKAFREDLLGEEARYRNARLAFYRGDFGWAQLQLSVLKASTSELIANDALYLSVLITENVTPDSNMVPLERFAYADLLLFQHKYDEATKLLDSIMAAFPKHPLNDDILMLHAKIAELKRDYPKTLEYYREVFTRHAQDVLADDALYNYARVSEVYLKQTKEAASHYEQLILKYPGSTYVQSARERLQQMKQSNVDL